MIDIQGMYLVFKNHVPSDTGSNAALGVLRELETTWGEVDQTEPEPKRETPNKHQLRIQTYGNQVTIHLLDKVGLRLLARKIHTLVSEILFGRMPMPTQDPAQRQVLSQYFALAEFEDWVALLQVTINPSGTVAEVRFLVAEDGTVSQKHLTLRGESAANLMGYLVCEFMSTPT